MCQRAVTLQHQGTRQPCLTRLCEEGAVNKLTSRFKPFNVRLEIGNIRFTPNFISSGGPYKSEPSSVPDKCQKGPSL